MINEVKSYYRGENDQGITIATSVNYKKLNYIQIRYHAYTKREYFYKIESKDNKYVITCGYKRENPESIIWSESTLQDYKNNKSTEEIFNTVLQYGDAIKVLDVYLFLQERINQLHDDDLPFPNRNYTLLELRDKLKRHNKEFI